MSSFKILFLLNFNKVVEVKDDDTKKLNLK